MPDGTHAAAAARRPVVGRRDLAELGLLALAFGLYFAVRGAVIDRPEVAYEHALAVIETERRLGIYVEDAWNAWAVAHRVWAQAMNLAYFWLHFPLIIAFGVWAYFARHHQYVFLRDAFLVSGGIALIVYWLYPVAPPRELPDLVARFDPSDPAGVAAYVDTMQRYLGYAYQSQSTRAFVNPFAAMPSLHFGWDLLLGIGIAWTLGRGRRAWLTVPAAVALPLIQVFAVVLTANHFFLDVVAGAVVALAGLAIAAALRRWTWPVLARRFGEG